LVSDAYTCPQCGERFEGATRFCPNDGTPLVADSSDLVGKLVGGRYQVLKRLGEGGMGQVYLAEHVRMKRKSAIKIMRPALLHEPEALQRFTREAENASKISHVNVASIFDFGETDEGLVYLAMEYIEGESLAAALAREKALHPLAAADIVAQAADALQAAHDLGILHRDFKPDNLMLTRRSDGTYLVKLVDFGIARTMERGTQQVTRTGFAVGTPEFMSPEQFSGDVLDGRSDQYSLALVAFVVLTGHEAFGGSVSKESLIARLTSRPRRLDEVRRDLEWPPQLQDIFDKALAPDPSDRFDRVADFGAQLADAIGSMTPTQTAEIYRHALGQRAPASLRPGLETPRVAPALANAAPASAPKPQPRRQDPLEFKRRPAILPWLFLLGVGTYGVWWYGSTQPSGAARDAAMRIEALALRARSMVMGKVGTVAPPADSLIPSGSASSPAPRRARKRSTAADSTRVDSGVTPRTDSAPTRGDTAVPPDA
jgi:eukaryotic-like serine/threonine-protein kinase